MVVPIRICVLVGRLSLALQAIKGRCPKCKQASIFKGFLTVHDRCPNCGLNFADNETADGPAFLVITFMGFVATGFAVWIELVYQPSYWIHALLWLPMILIISPILLRLTKSLMISYQYEHLIKKDQP